jgi:hypothetical protein
MKKVLSIEPLAPMASVSVEANIIAEEGEKILIQDWRGYFLQLTPSCVKDNTIIYRVEDQASDLSLLKFKWTRKEIGYV